jgi:hypothetical protein
MKHLLVTNDFPPKIGGIQSLLWEWWRRLPHDTFAVLTSPYEGAAEFDANEGYRIERTAEPVLLPHPLMVRRVDSMARDFGADLVVLDPAVPLGLVGPSLELPYDLVLPEIGIEGERLRHASRNKGIGQEDVTLLRERHDAKRIADVLHALDALCHGESARPLRLAPDEPVEQHDAVHDIRADRPALDTLRVDER